MKSNFGWGRGDCSSAAVKSVCNITALKQDCSSDQGAKGPPDPGSGLSEGRYSSPPNCSPCVDFCHF